MQFKNLRAFFTTLTFALAGATAWTAPAGAAPVSNFECANAGGSVTNGAAMKMPAATGNLDKDFATAMIAQMQAMTSMAKIETECGKSPKTKVAAQRYLDEAKSHLETMNLILHTN